MRRKSPKQITMSNVLDVKLLEPDRPIPFYLRGITKRVRQKWPPWAPHPLAIYILQRASGLPPDEFAAKIGVTADCVARWQRGEHHPEAEECERMRQEFGDILFRAMECAERFECERAVTPKMETELAKAALRRNLSSFQPAAIQVAAAKHLLDRNLGLPVAPSIQINSTVAEFESLKKKYGSRVLPADYIAAMKKAGYYPNAKSDRKSPDVHATPETPRLAPPTSEDEARADREPSGEDAVNGG